MSLAAIERASALEVSFVIREKKPLCLSLTCLFPSERVVKEAPDGREAGR